MRGRRRPPREWEAAEAPRRPRRRRSAGAAGNSWAAVKRWPRAPPIGLTAPVPRSGATVSFLIGAVVAGGSWSCTFTNLTRPEYAQRTTGPTLTKFVPGKHVAQPSSDSVMIAEKSVA
jgi:hypothetical protein